MDGRRSMHRTDIFRRLRLFRGRNNCAVVRNEEPGQASDRAGQDMNTRSPAAPHAYPSLKDDEFQITMPLLSVVAAVSAALHPPTSTGECQEGGLSMICNARRHHCF